MTQVLKSLGKMLFFAACGFAVTLGVAAAGALIWWVHFEFWRDSAIEADTTYESVARQMQ